jgi:hypothetical protein
VGTVTGPTPWTVFRYLNPMMRTVFAWRKKGNKKRDSRWHEMA